MTSKRSARIQILKIIKGAIQVLKKHGWTRGQIARTSTGAATYAMDPKAVRFCAIGAIYRAQHKLENMEDRHHANEARIAVEQTIGQSRSLATYNSLSSYNDSMAKSKRDVIQLFQTTARRLTKEIK